MARKLSEIINEENPKFKASITNEPYFENNKLIQKDTVTKNVGIADDNETVSFGTDKDFCMGYHSTDNVFKITDGNTLNNIAPSISINKSKMVGIGTNNPKVPLHIIKGSASSYNNYVETQTVLALENNSYTRLQMISGNSYGSTISFANSTNNNIRGWITYYNSANRMEIGTNGSSRMAIDSAGYTGIGTMSPKSPLHIVKGSTDFTNYNTTQGVLALENKGQYTRQQMIAESSYGSLISFCNAGTNSEQGWITYDNNISRLRFGAGSANRMAINNSTDITTTIPMHVTNSSPRHDIGSFFNIGTASDSGICWGNSTSDTQGVMICTSTGSIYIKNRSVAWNVHLDKGSSAWVSQSDRRIKSEITTIPNALSIIERLNPVTYQLHQTDCGISTTEGKFTVLDESRYDAGFIAQEVYDIEELRHMVEKPENEEFQIWAMSNEKMIPYLAKAIKELNEKVKVLEAKSNA